MVLNNGHSRYATLAFVVRHGIGSSAIGGKLEILWRYRLWPRPTTSGMVAISRPHVAKGLHTGHPRSRCRLTSEHRTWLRGFESRPIFDNPTHCDNSTLRKATTKAGDSGQQIGQTRFQASKALI